MKPSLSRAMAPEPSTAARRRSLDSRFGADPSWGTTPKEAPPMPGMQGYFALKGLPEERVTDRISRRVLTGAREMIVFWSIKAGAHAAAHAHPHEQMFWVLSGRMDFRLGDERRSCGPGPRREPGRDRKSTRLHSSHRSIS